MKRNQHQVLHDPMAHRSTAEILEPGERHNWLTLVREVGARRRVNGQRRRYILAHCLCGSDVEVELWAWRYGYVKSCGCIRKGKAPSVTRSDGRPPVTVYPNTKVGALTFLEEVPGIYNTSNGEYKRRRGRFQCECGKIIERDIHGWRYKATACRHRRPS